MSFFDFISNLSILNYYKKEILNNNFINNNPSYYQNYPSLFDNVFSTIIGDIELLDIAGFLYYRATILTDELIDNKDISKFPLITVCQEESIKILTHIFGLENNFWHLWNQRKNEYLKAIELEHNLNSKSEVTIEEYETVADYKAAFGKVAIDCLFCIDSSNPEMYEKLLLSHKYFSVAFQLNDDIQDFKDDLKSGQFNWAVYLLKQENLTSDDPNILEKYLYIRGISKKIYNLGITYCQKAHDIVKNIEVQKWKTVLDDTIKSFRTAIIEIDNYLEILTSEITLNIEQISKNNISKSLINAIEFIKSKQTTDGCWREYCNQGGISNIWATAFILSKISENKQLKIDFQKEIKFALTFIQNNSKGNLWGYNDTWIADADSTNFVMLSYILNNVEINPNTFNNWLKYQKDNGGFSTYVDAKNLLLALDHSNIKNVDGWTNSHNCVSAVSFYFLTKYNLEHKASIKLRGYFNDNIESQTQSYWWTNDIYTYYYLAKTYFLLNDDKKLSFIFSKIKSMQNTNGSFSDSYGANMFYTGLALEILLLSSNFKSEIDNIIAYLMQKQYNDGSWANSNALQVPNATDIVPSKNAFPIATFGMNVRAKEFNRLFTTSTILNSISIYDQKYDSNTLN